MCGRTGGTFLLPRVQTRRHEKEDVLSRARNVNKAKHLTSNFKNLDWLGIAI